MTPTPGSDNRDLRTHYLERTPDIPKHVYLRALLLDPSSTVSGSSEGVIVISSKYPLAFLRGRLLPDLLHSSLRDDMEILSEGPVAGFPTGWVWQSGTLMTLADGERLRQLAEEARDLVVPLTAELLELAPAHLRRDLGIAFDTGSVVCALVEGMPVSFASVSLCSESYFDVTVDTLDAFQNRGFARRCAAVVIAAEMLKGRSPIWGSKDSNSPSIRAGQSLGFVHRERLWMATMDPIAK